jgi:hypothetical protein
MITCQHSDGLYDVCGITAFQMEIVEEALQDTFNKAHKIEHKDYRHNVLEIVSPITEILDKTLPCKNELTLF